MSPSTAEHTKADRCAYPSGRATGTQRCWSTARYEEAGRSDGQAFTPLRAPTLERLPPALRFHALPEAVGLLPTALIWLERAFHGRPLSVPTDVGTRPTPKPRSVNSTRIQVNSRSPCDRVSLCARFQHPLGPPREVLFFRCPLDRPCLRYSPLSTRVDNSVRNSLRNFPRALC